MTLTQRQRGLTIRARHPRWLQVYPLGFWQPWHMSLLGHDMLPTERPVALMDSLYRTDLQKTPPAAELLSFEARTSLPHLPHQTGVTETLLLDFAQELEQARDPRTFWPPQSLQRHFDKHVIRQDSGPYLQGAARAGMVALARLTGVAPARLAPLDPGNVDDAWSYAQLARLLLLLSLAAERPFGFTLYCPTGEYRLEHGLVLNIRVPPDFFRVAGQPSDREVLLGLTLGGSQHVPGPQGGVQNSNSAPSSRPHPFRGAACTRQAEPVS